MPESSHRRFRFRLSTLLVAMVFVAIAASAIASGAEGWDKAFGVVMVTVFSWAVVMALVLDGSSRVFWVGFLVFGISFLASTQGKLEWLGVAQDDVPSAMLIDQYLDWAYPFAPDPKFPGAWSRPPGAKVVRIVMHDVLAIMVACIAGRIVQRAFDSKQPSGS